jgi:hypothetical protein
MQDFEYLSGRAEGMRLAMDDTTFADALCRMLHYCDLLNSEESRVAELEEIIQHTMLEVPGYDSEIHTDPNGLPTMVHGLRQSLCDVKDRFRAAPTWVVNDTGELGVHVNDRYFFLYKGISLEYEDGRHDDGTQMMVRPVYQREFGEVCCPKDWWPICDKCMKAPCKYPERYTVGDGWVSLSAKCKDDR